MCVIQIQYKKVLYKAGVMAKKKQLVLSDKKSIG